MLGRKQAQIDRLQEEVETLRGDLITLENLKAKNIRLEERLTTMQRNVARADQDREEALDKAYEAGKQIDYLAAWFQDRAPNRIKEGGAVDNAIRLLNQLLLTEEEITHLQALLDEANGLMGVQDAELKQLKIELAATHKAANEVSAKAVNLDPKILEQVEDALEHPEKFVKRNRPQRSS
jgi:TolA-binding protein